MRKIAIVFFIFLLITPSLALANESHDKNQQIEAFMKKAIKDYHIPGASLIVVHKDQTIFQNSWGTMSDGSSVTSDTTFLIGSLSKPLTAVAIMTLVEDGKIKLDEPIETYIPWFTYHTDSAKSITVRHLLEQMSGISAYDGMKVTDHRGRDKEKGITDAVTELSGVTLSRIPGEGYEYNSANYLILGAIIEAVSNRTFSQFMNTQVFDPLGMNNTTADYDSAVKKGMVPGYQSWLGRAVEGDGLYDQSGAPYGYMTSTANDLAKFLDFMLDGGELLTEQSLLQLQTPPEDGRRYGFGWHFPKSGMKYPFHTGATPEYKSEIFFMPEQKLGAVLVTNKYHELEAVSYLSVMEGIRSIMNGKGPELAPLHVTTQWITLGVVVLFTVLSILSVFLLKRKKKINKMIWTATGVVSLICATGLIPLFTSSMGISWRTVGLFLPDIEFLVYGLVVILAVQGLLIFLFVAKKKKASVSMNSGGNLSASNSKQS